MTTVKQLVYSYESAEEVELDFYKAFGYGDFALMESLYADHGVSYTHSSCPTIIGRENVINNWKFVLEGIPKTVIDREILSVSKCTNIEVHQVLESFVVDGFTNDISQVYTMNVFILQENGWRLQMQHASVAEIKKTESPLMFARNEMMSVNIEDFHKNRVLN